LSIVEKDQLACKITELENALSELWEKLKTVTKNGEIDFAELEQVFAILRLRRQHNMSLEFLSNMDDAQKDKKMIQELKIQLSELLEELEKKKKMLEIQEQINGDYKGELKDMQITLENIQKDFDLQRVEDAKLIELRGRRIAELEAQLQKSQLSKSL
jgi:hypothetical protein